MIDAPPDSEARSPQQHRWAIVSSVSSVVVRVSVHRGGAPVSRPPRAFFQSTLEKRNFSRIPAPTTSICVNPTAPRHLLLNPPSPLPPAHQRSDPILLHALASNIPCSLVPSFCHFRSAAAPLWSQGSQAPSPPPTRSRVFP